MSDSLPPHGLYSPWNSPGQNTGVDSCSLFQGIFPNPGIKPRSPALQADSLPSEPPGEAGRNINNLRYADDTTRMAESGEELRSLLMNVKEQSGKTGLKFNIKKTKIMASGPNRFMANRWETVTDLFSWAPKSLQIVATAMKLKDTRFLEENL